NRMGRLRTMRRLRRTSTSGGARRKDCGELLRLAGLRRHVGAGKAVRLCGTHRDRMFEIERRRSASLWAGKLDNALPRVVAVSEMTDVNGTASIKTIREPLASSQDTRLPVDAPTVCDQWFQLRAVLGRTVQRRQGRRQRERHQCQP